MFSNCTPAVCPQTPVNDWTERKCKRDSEMILENHQAKILWNRAGKGEKSEHLNNVSHLAIPDYCQAVPLNKNTAKLKEDKIGIWL